MRPSSRRVENIRSGVDEQKNGRNCRDSLVNIFSIERSSQESRGFSHERFNGENLVGLDACTALSHRCNVFKIEEAELNG